MTPLQRLELVARFLSVGRDLVGSLPGKLPEAEAEMAELVKRYSRQLIGIGSDPLDASEIQLSLWLRNLASLPVRSSLRWEVSVLVRQMGLAPRAKGRPVLEPAIFPCLPRVV